MRAVWLRLVPEIQAAGAQRGAHCAGGCGEEYFLWFHTSSHFLFHAAHSAAVCAAGRAARILPLLYAPHREKASAKKMGVSLDNAAAALYNKMKYLFRPHLLRL